MYPPASSRSRRSSSDQTASRIESPLGNGPNGHSSASVPTMNRTRPREGMPFDRSGLLGHTPLLTVVGVIAHQFLFLGVRRDDRVTRRQGPLYAPVDMRELGVPLGVVLPLRRLSVALQTVVLLV